MKPSTPPPFTQDELALLDESLHYMSVGEIKKSCIDLSLPYNGKKGELIERIIEFLRTGTIKVIAPIPPQSRADCHPPQPIASTSLLLYGSYKNDSQTRAFFKNYIGSHFHFTAFGIDWLNERWTQGKPPTFEEFATFWIHESARRKKRPAAPKKEWAFIRFLQQMQREKPETPKNYLMSLWKKVRLEKVNQGKELLQRAPISHLHNRANS